MQLVLPHRGWHVGRRKLQQSGRDEPVWRFGHLMKKRSVWVAAAKGPRIRSHSSRLRFRTDRGVNLGLVLCSPTDFSVMGYEQKSGPDRKSTRLNSSHGSISYAVF